MVRNDSPAPPSRAPIGLQRLGRWTVLTTAVVAALVLVVTSCGVGSRGPAPLPALASAPGIGSSGYGSGDYGSWETDGQGLPAFRLTADPSKAAHTPTQVGGGSEIVHQVGNDHIVAAASADGSTELWSQDRLYQWVNHTDPADGHYAGGYGYLNVGGQVFADRAGAGVGLTFGVGYVQKDLTVDGLRQRTYAPFGDAPVLLDDVTLTNSSTTSRTMSWYEYWDVNPYDQTTGTPRGMAAPVWDPTHKVLSVAQDPMSADARPLSIYAAALEGPVSGTETSAPAFFGAGGQDRPAEVTADSLSGSTAPAVADGTVGSTLFAFRAPVTLGPGQSVTLRYAYGAADPSTVQGTLASVSMPGSFEASERAWSAWLPRVQVGTTDPWLGREVAWDAYTLRSGSTYEDCAGAHVISQGGYYQYQAGLQEAYRDPLQFALPMVYSDPGLARDIIRYSAQEQTSAGATPYATGPLCQPLSVGISDDMDVWLLLAADEYGLATRDWSFFDQQVPYRGGGSATLWAHLQLAFQHQETLIGPHGDYQAGYAGDWSDLSTRFLGLTESSVTAQVATVYPLTAQLADARHDATFAAELRKATARADGVLASDWTTSGWYGRGWAGSDRVGTWAIFEEPQPWALMSGVPSPAQAVTTVANIRRYLTGVGAPAVVGGPARIGSSQSPAADDPGVAERTTPPVGIGDNNAVYVGGTWYALNGTLVWALTELDGTVPGAAADAFDEFLRNTLADHAAAYPTAWDGTISVDDVCWSFYSSKPGNCGSGLNSSYQGQVMHQPAWTLFDVVALTGIRPSATAYRIDPHWPASSFSVELPDVGVARTAHRLQGYLVVQSTGTLPVTVTVPPGVDPARTTVWVSGSMVTPVRRGDTLTFVLPTRSGQRADWALSW